MKRILRSSDPWIFFLAIAATILGIVFIQDAGYARWIQSGRTGIPQEVRTQIGLAIASLFAYKVCSGVKIEQIRTWSKLIWLVNLVLLLLVRFAGHRLNGAQRWLGFGALSIQPAEFAKVAAIVYLAGYFANRKAWPARIKPQRDWALRIDNIWVPKITRCGPAIWVAISAVLVLVEPDMGTAAVILATGYAMFFPGGVTVNSRVVAFVFAVLAAGIAVKIEPYRLQRVLDHPTRWTAKNIDDTEFQTVQAELAIATGGLKGVGLGQGRAKHILPATTTDYIGATIGEETGLIGSLGILALLGAMVFRLFYLAQRAPSRFGMLLTFGVACWLGIQTCVNLMMANAFLPSIGIPLPFISSGGSSLMALWMAMGLCQAAMVPEPTRSEQSKQKVARRTRNTKPYDRGTNQVPVLTTNYRGRLR